MDGGVVQHISALLNTEKTGTLFKSFRTKLRNLFQLCAGMKGSVLLPIAYDIFSNGRGNASDVFKKRRRGGIQIDTDCINTILDNTVQGLTEPFLRVFTVNFIYVFFG